jgi:uncharacterized membrane protein
MRFRLILVRLLTLFALAISTAQFADHLTGANAICEFGDSCEQVTNSVYGKPLGIPLPLVGLVGFGLLYTLTLVPTLWAVCLVRALGIIAGVIGIGLLTLQFAVLHKVCPLCLMVDSASIALAVIVAIGLPEPVALSRFRLLGWIAIAPVILFIPIGWVAATMPEQAPEQVRAYWKDNEVTIVEITDFECPYCRQADAVMQEVLSHNKVHFVRLPCPLPLHMYGMTAARAYYAAEQQGKGHEMAAALYAADSRTEDQCQKIAEKLGLNIEQYQRSFNDPKAENEPRATIAWARQNKSGLPMIWVQNQLLQGIPSAEAIQHAIDKAKATMK